jgi:putative transposase
LSARRMPKSSRSSFPVSTVEWIASLSASTIARLKEVWIDEHEHWRKRDLSAKHYVYVWADGIYLQARLEDAKQCILVIISATPEGRKELLGFTDGARESAQDWRELLLYLKNRGLAVAPELAFADGALGLPSKAIIRR